MDVKQQVFMRLKPKARAFGFNKDELMGVAVNIANNLQFEEDALEDEINAEIDKQVDAVIPFLRLAQTNANRVIEKTRKELLPQEAEEEPNKTNPVKTETKTDPDEMPAWAKALIESNKALTEKVASMQGEKTLNARQARLEAILKDTGTFGTRTLKSFAKMSFDTDEEFDDFVAEVESDLKSYNQERANAGLQTLGAIPTQGGGKKEEILTDAEVEAIVASL